jgi:hypothetical protein
MLPLLRGNAGGTASDRTPGRQTDQALRRLGGWTFAPASARSRSAAFDPASQRRSGWKRGQLRPDAGPDDRRPQCSSRGGGAPPALVDAPCGLAALAWRRPQMVRTRLSSPALAFLTMPWKYPPGLVRKCSAHGDASFTPQRARNPQLTAQPVGSIDDVAPNRLGGGQVGPQPRRQLQQLVDAQPHHGAVVGPHRAVARSTIGAGLVFRRIRPPFGCVRCRADGAGPWATVLVGHYGIWIQIIVGFASTLVGPESTVSATVGCA